MRPEWKKFFQETSIHALPQIYSAPTILEKVVWSVLFVAATGVCINQFYNLICTFNLEQVGTNFFMPSTSDYARVQPMVNPLFYCASDWLNISKIEELRVPEEVLMYALSYLEWPASKFGRGAMERMFNGSEAGTSLNYVNATMWGLYEYLSKPLEEFSKEDITPILPNLTAVQVMYCGMFHMLRLDTHDNLEPEKTAAFLNFTFEYEDIGTKTHQQLLDYLKTKGYELVEDLLYDLAVDHFSSYPQPIIGNVSKAIRQGRVCEVLNLTEIQTRQWTKPMLYLVANHTHSLHNSSYYNVTAHLSFYEGYQPDMIGGDDLRHLIQDQIHATLGYTSATITVDISRNQRRNRHVAPCNGSIVERKPQDVNDFNCEATCVNMFVFNKYGCSNIMQRASKSKNSLTPLCDLKSFMSLALNLSNVFDPEWLDHKVRCEQECKNPHKYMPCYDWKIVYDTYIIPQIGFETQAPVDLISIDIEAKSVVITSEVMLYGIDQLLSDLGGIIGVCVGASILSVIHPFIELIKSIVAHQQEKKQAKQQASKGASPDTVSTVSAVSSVSARQQYVPYDWGNLKSKSAKQLEANGTARQAYA